MALTKINDFYSFNFNGDYLIGGKINRGIEYSSFLSYLYNSEISEKVQPVASITFQVTDNCNLCCSYCYQINKGKNKMPLDVAKKFIDLLLYNSEQTKKYIDTRNTFGVIFDFVGGEPFLEIELIEQIIEYFENQAILKNHPWQYHHKYSFSSNGTLYFDPKVQRFLKKYQKNISLGISVDGNKELHDACRIFPDGTGSYDLAMAAAQDWMINYNSPVGSKITISPENINFLSEAIINMIENHYHSIHLNCIFEKGWKNQHATTLYYQLKQIINYIIANDLEDYIDLSMFNQYSYKPIDIEDTTNWCGGNGRMLALDYKGDMYPCLRYMESSLGENVPAIKVGNIYEGFLPNSKCEACIEKLKQVNRINQSTQECIDCSVAQGCSWCQAYNYQDSGDFKHRATYICQMHKAASLANVYYWNLLMYKKKVKKSFKRYLSDEEALNIISQEELILLNNLENGER